RPAPGAGGTPGTQPARDGGDPGGRGEGHEASAGCEGRLRTRAEMSGRSASGTLTYGPEGRLSLVPSAGSTSSGTLPAQPVVVGGIGRQLLLLLRLRGALERQPLMEDGLLIGG